LVGNLTKAIAISGQRQRQECGDVECRERQRVPPGRQNLYVQHDAGFTPRAPAGRALNSKCISTLRQSGVGSNPLVTADLVPLMIQFFQLVAIAIGYSIEITER